MVIFKGALFAQRLLSTGLLIAGMAIFAGCPVPVEEEDAGSSEDCVEGNLRCVEPHVLEECGADGNWAVKEDCAATEMICHALEDPTASHCMEDHGDGGMHHHEDGGHHGADGGHHGADGGHHGADGGHHGADGGHHGGHHDADGGHHDADGGISQSYCDCVFLQCHDEYHATWGENEITARAACVAFASGFSAEEEECRMSKCEMVNTLDCDAALSVDSCLVDGGA
jgi:hypothetical protein